MLALDARRGEATPGEIGDHRPDRTSLGSRELTGSSDHVVIEIERGTHAMMLPHHRINNLNPQPPKLRRFAHL
jgi:hypothetical protein